MQSNIVSSYPFSFQINMHRWNDVNQMIPKYSKFQVIDYETGATFSVQRRAGSKHADVQPLTNKDTEIFKKIYNGKWSWNRRAALVLVNDQLIAASMHGMPHGAGALQNGFPGHFCIHFYESTTHGSTTPDFDHYLMILRSAGKLEQFLNAMSSNEAVNVLFTAINNNDVNLLNSVVFTDQNKATKEPLQRLAMNIEGIRWRMFTVNYEGSDLLSFNLPVEVNMYEKNKGLKKATIELHLMRSSLLDRWKVDPNPLIKLIQE